ncbi:MAG: NFYB/HAP3 family transcription factor subunit [Candidatus Aenigmatarchaeota archaeon]|nr:NFYB/HAP3 family transcription factor subunit [Candidatus Aenigmarchaeota archaeon]
MKKIFSINYFKKLAKDIGIKRVSYDAAKELAIILQEKVSEVLTIANEIAKHAKRNTIFKEDIKIALKKLKLK